MSPAAASSPRATPSRATSSTFVGSPSGDVSSLEKSINRQNKELVRSVTAATQELRTIKAQIKQGRERTEEVRQKVVGLEQASAENQRRVGASIRSTRDQIMEAQSKDKSSAQASIKALDSAVRTVTQGLVAAREEEKAHGRQHQGSVRTLTQKMEMEGTEMRQRQSELQ
ncbi:hypothetical protein KIPB_009474, partial [Kipferlia bialata]|eukprot:g9474.t1